MTRQQKSIQEAQSLVRAVLSHLENTQPSEENVKIAALKVARTVSNVRVRELEDA